MKKHHCALALALLLSPACSGDNGASSSLGEGKYAISTTVFSDDSQTSPLSVTENPGEPGELDTDRANEFGGTTALFGQLRQLADSANARLRHSSQAGINQYL